MTEDELMQEIADNISYMLEDSRMTQKELARICGVTEATISRYINAERMPSLPNLLRIAYGLCCELTDLVVWTGEYIES